VAERCNCVRKLPPIACLAFCEARPNDSEYAPRSVSDSGSVSPACDDEASPTSSPVAASAKNAGGGVLFADPSFATAETSMSSVPSDVQHHAGIGERVDAHSRQGVGNG
jgi:hypothetical protein